MDNGQASSLSLSLEQTGPGSRGTRHGDDRNDAFHKFCSSSYPRRRVEITKEELESVTNLSFREAALKLGVSRTTIQRLRRKYKIPLGPVSIHFAKLSTFGSVLDAPLAQTRALAIHVLTARPYFWFLHEPPPTDSEKVEEGSDKLREPGGALPLSVQGGLRKAPSEQDDSVEEVQGVRYKGVAIPARQEPPGVPGNQKDV